MGFTANGWSHEIQGDLVTIEIGSFTTGGGEARVKIRTREHDGHTSATVNLDEAALDALLACLVAAYGDARCKSALQVTAEAVRRCTYCGKEKGRESTVDDCPSNFHKHGN